MVDCEDDAFHSPEASEKECAEPVAGGGGERSSRTRHSPHPRRVLLKDDIAAKALGDSEERIR